MKKKQIKLNKDHHWTALPGHKVLVAGRGAVRFDFPETWHFEVGDDSIRLYDIPPPDDECRLEMSCHRLPPIAPDAFPLDDIVQKVAAGYEDAIGHTDLRHLRRAGWRLAWLDVNFIDKQTQRPARSRIAVGLGATLWVLFTFAFWEDDVVRITPVWDNVLKTLQLGQFIADPRDGRAINPLAQ